MITDLLAFLQNEWQLISDNPWCFIIFGAFCFLIGYAIAWNVHNYLLEVKLHNIPEREELQQKILELQNQVEKLKKELHKQDINGYIQEIRDGYDSESIGAVIARNKKN